LFWQEICLRTPLPLQNNFNDIVRRRELDDKAFLPSRFFELQDQQSSRSLAQIYEDEFTAAQTTASGGKVIDPRDAKLQKEHEEIDKLWGDISYTLDALSNLNYTPKQVRGRNDLFVVNRKLISSFLILLAQDCDHHHF
jgi:U3 small nucleolar ribonucleoprotein component